MTDDPPRFASIVDCVIDHARRIPDRPAIVSEDGTVTYDRLRAQVEELAGQLLEIGVQGVMTDDPLMLEDVITKLEP